MFTSAAPTTIRFLTVLLVAALFSFLFSCTTVKNYPSGRPFVYNTTVHLQGKFSADERKQLTDQLYQQLHDSMRPRKVTKLLFLQSLNNPPAFDTSNADKSIVFMSALLNSLGYYRDSINYTRKIDTVSADELRTSVDFNVVSARLFKVDSIRYNMLPDSLDTARGKLAERDTLQKLTSQTMKDAQIKKGDPFSKPLLSNEINRLADVYRDNGFLRFSSEELLVVWDTIGLALIRPTLDPIEQAAQLEELRRRRLNPTTDIEIRLRSSSDTSHLIRYYVGDVKVYPDLNADTALYFPTFDTVRGYPFVSYQNLFKPRKLVDNIYLRPGDLYRQSNFLKTQNKFNSLSAWRLVTISPFPRIGQDTVDFEIKLTPARKYLFNANLEGSRNQSPLAPEGNLLGLGVTLGLQNRNFAKAANLAITNFRYGTELNSISGTNPIQTQQFSLSHTIQFPRKVPRDLPLFRRKENVRTVFGLSAAYTDRKDYYTVKSFNTSWGYEASWKNKLLGIRFPNIEYNALVRKDSLEAIISKNASYKYIFNDGLILSTLLNLRVAGGKKNVTNLTTLSFETSGIVASLIKSDFLDSNLYRFIKLDAEFRQTRKVGNHSNAFAWRIFGGIGYGLPRNNLDSANFFLPFFRQYYAGGPNSMRAWGVRRLGPGSTIKSYARTDAPDRFGDMRLEANAEFRFKLIDWNGIILNGALFTDIGNVWFLRKNPDFPEGEFRLNKLWKDIAIGTGTGLRVDFGFLKVRFEYAYKVKDPSPDILNASEQNKWFYNWRLNNGQFQLGIDYPF